MPAAQNVCSEHDCVPACDAQLLQVVTTACDAHMLQNDTTACNAQPLQSVATACDARDLQHDGTACDEENVTTVQVSLSEQTSQHWDANAPVLSNAMPAVDSQVLTCTTDRQDMSECLTACDEHVSKRPRSHSTTAQTSQQSVLSFLLTLQTQEATKLAQSLSVKQAKTRLSRPLAGNEEHLPPPPKPHFLTVTPGLVTDLVNKTNSFKGVVHSFGNNNQLLVQVPGSDQLQIMQPGHHYLMIVQPQHVQKALQLYHQVKAQSPATTTVVLVTQSTVVSTTPSLISWNTLQSVPPTSLNHPGRARKWTAVTDYRIRTLEEPGMETYEFQSGQHAMAVTANLAGAVHNILLDSGASGTAYITQAFVYDLGLPVIPLSKPYGVKMGDCVVVQGLGFCTLPLRLGTLKCKVQCLVLPNLPVYPLILGDPWLQAFRAQLSYTTHTVSLTTPRGKEITLQSATQPRLARTAANQAPSQPTDHTTLAELYEGLELGKSETLFSINKHTPAADTLNLVSGKRLAKWVQKNQVEQCQLIMINQVGEDDIVCTAAGQEGSVVDKWKAAVPGDDIHSMQLRALLASKAHLCGDELKGLPPARVPREVIPLIPGAHPTNRPMFRYSQPELEEMRTQVKTLLDSGLVQKSTSPFGAPVLFVKKKDGTMRMCVDYRALNKITVPNRYPLPRVDDLLDKLQGATVFSSLDLLSGYHQIRLPDSDVPKTAFRTPFGLYEYKVMPFGLTNAPSVFMACMNDMLSHLPFCVVYLDDILIFSKSPQEHVQHVAAVLEVLEQHQFLIKLKKCDFFKQELLYLGHVISADGIKPDPKKVEAVKNFPTPTTVQTLKSFLGLVQWFHRSIKDLAKIASPLSDLLQGPAISKRKSAKVDLGSWSLAHDKAFAEVKQALINAATLKLPDLNKPFQVVTDASGYALGAVLIQDGRPVAFESKKMNSAQRNYHTTDKELLAIVHALKLWRCYLAGAKFEILTDHKPLIYLRTQPVLSQRQARWSEFLSEFFVNWEYLPGDLNPADSLSRVHNEEPQPTVLTMLISTRQAQNLQKKTKRKRAMENVPEPLVQGQQSELTQQVTVDELLQGYAKDPWFQKPENTAPYTRDKRGLWCKRDLVLVPKAPDLRLKIFTAYHCAPAAGHSGITKTFDLITRHFWWPGLRKDVRAFISVCDSCQRVKAGHQHPAGLLQPLPIPENRWQMVSMDFIVELPTCQGLNAILVFVDVLTKMAHFAACKTTCTAEQAAELFNQHVFRLHGLPRVMLHDRGTQFTSQFWTHFYSLCGVAQANSSAYHPQTDGQTERVNRVLEDYLRHYISPLQDNWVTMLTFAEFAYNNAVHESTGASPFRLNYGFDPVAPGQDVGQPPITAEQVKQQKVICPAAQRHFEYCMQQSLQSAKQHLAVAKERQKKYADAKRRHCVFSVGDKVLLSTKNLSLKGGGSRKLLPRYIGPFTITKSINGVTYTLDLPKGLKTHPTFHISLLRLYKEDPAYLFKAPPLPEVIEGHLEYEVDHIVDHRRMGDTLEFLVRWKGYQPSDDTWEPESNLKNCPKLLREYKSSPVFVAWLQQS